MKKLILFLFLLIPIKLFCQSNTQLYWQAEALIAVGNYTDAYNVLKTIDLSKTRDTIYPYIIESYALTVSKLERSSRKNEDWNNSLKYGLEALDIFAKGVVYDPDKFQPSIYLGYNAVIISYFALSKFDDAKSYQDKLYVGYKEGKLPEVISKTYNFDFFKWGDKNVWGYEWYPPLEDGGTASYSRIIYYVYSTNTDGSDKESLYQIHVNKANGNESNYVLIKSAAELSETLIGYNYNENIDYKKLRNDVQEVVKNNN